MPAPVFSLIRKAAHNLESLKRAPAQRGNGVARIDRRSVRRRRKSGREMAAQQLITRCNRHDRLTIVGDPALRDGFGRLRSTDANDRQCRQEDHKTYGGGVPIVGNEKLEDEA